MKDRGQRRAQYGGICTANRKHERPYPPAHDVFAANDVRKPPESCPFFGSNPVILSAMNLEVHCESVPSFLGVRCKFSM